MARPDGFVLEWHPTRSAKAEVGSGEWVTLVTAIQDLECSHGFERTVSRVETGELIAKVRMDGRNLDPTNRTGPWFPNLVPMRHIRLMAQTGGTWYEVWRGFTVSFDPQWEVSAAWCTITAVDSLVHAAQVITTPVLETAIQALNPTIWFPLDDGGAVTARGLGQSPGGSAVSTISEEGVLPFANQRSTSFPYPGSSRIDVVAGAGSLHVNPAGFSVMGVFKADRDDINQCIFSAGPQPVAAATPAGDVAFGLSPGGKYDLRVGNASGSNFLQFSQPNNDVSTLVMGWYSPTKIGLEATIGFRAIGGNEINVTTAYAPRAGAMRIGAGLDTANILQFLGNLSHVALWNRVLTGDERNQIYRGFWGKLRADGVSRDAADVIHWVLDRIGVPTGKRLVSDAPLFSGSTKVDTPALDMLARAANTERGLFFVDRTGNWVFKLVGQKGAFRGTYDTKPEGTTRAGTQDITMTMDDRSFYTVAQVTVTTGSQDGTEVVYRHPNADVYGDIVYDAPTQFETREEAYTQAVAIVGDTQPKIEVTDMQVAAGGFNVNLADLLQSDVNDEIVVYAQIPGNDQTGTPLKWDTGPGWDSGVWGVEPPYSRRMTILHVEHTYDGQENAWYTRWVLTPS